MSFQLLSVSFSVGSEEKILVMHQRDENTCRSLYTLPSQPGHSECLWFPPSITAPVAAEPPILDNTLPLVHQPSCFCPNATRNLSAAVQAKDPVGGRCRQSFRTVFSTTKDRYVLHVQRQSIPIQAPLSHLLELTLAQRENR